MKLGYLLAFCKPSVGQKEESYIPEGTTNITKTASSHGTHESNKTEEREKVKWPASHGSG